MPFTPLHLGPGLAIKALLGDRLSLIAFGLAQVVMDLEPLVGLINGAAVLHGVTHTYLAAILIAGLVALITPAIGRPILRRWNRELAYYGLSWLVTPASLAWGPVILGALTGTLSHVALDSLMHADITPLMPWSSTNGWLGVVSMSTLQWGCLLAGAVGGALWLIRAWRQRGEIDHA